jgi:hypothetical protein
LIKYFKLRDAEKKPENDEAVIKKPMKKLAL